MSTNRYRGSVLVVYNGFMTTAKTLAIETAALNHGVSVQFYNKAECAMGRGRNASNPDTVSASADTFAALAGFRNELAKSDAMIGSKMTKTRSSGYWNMGVFHADSYGRTVTL